MSDRALHIAYVRRPITNDKSRFHQLRTAFGPSLYVSNSLGIMTEPSLRGVPQYLTFFSTAGSSVIP